MNEDRRGLMIFHAVRTVRTNQVRRASDSDWRSLHCDRSVQRAGRNSVHSHLQARPASEGSQNSHTLGDKKTKSYPVCVCLIFFKSRQPLSTSS